MSVGALRKPEPRVPAPGAAGVFKPAFERLPAGELLEHYRTRVGIHYTPVPSAEETRRDRIDAILEDRFDLVGETHVLSDPPLWSVNPSVDRQWHIALHKFYYAVGLGMAYQEAGDRRYVRKWISLTSSWIDQMTPLSLNSQVTGRRIQNWIYAYHYFVLNGASGDVPVEFHRRFLVSLCQQVNALRSDLDPSRNHRTLEIHAIFLASVVFPEFEDADDWREFALGEMLENMRADLLPDGVQCELSTHYHHTALKNYLNFRRLAQTNGIPVRAEMDVRIRKALDFALHIHKPDGTIPSLSDGDIGSHLGLLRDGYELYGDAELLFGATLGKEGRPPADRAKGFHDGGYYIVRSGWGDRGERYRDERYLVFDCGPPGRGDHGHLDLLNIEAAAFGESLIVDPGRYTYSEAGAVNWRAKFRGTAYHNTVLVDGRNQARYLPGHGNKHRVQGPAPEHELREFVSEDGFDLLHGIARSHEYDAVHERRIFFVCGEYWVVSDVLTAGETHLYEQLFHLSGRAWGEASTEMRHGTRLVQAPHVVLAQSRSPDVSLSIDKGYVSGIYGEKRPAPVVRFARRGRDAVFHTVLYPFGGDAPAIAVREIPVLAEQGDGPANGAHGFCVTVERNRHRFTDFYFAASGRPARRWLFAGHRYDGHFLFFRRSQDGRIVRRHTSAGATLEASRSSIAVNGATG